MFLLLNNQRPEKITIEDLGEIKFKIKDLRGKKLGNNSGRTVNKIIDLTDENDNPLIIGFKNCAMKSSDIYENKAIMWSDNLRSVADHIISNFSIEDYPYIDHLKFIMHSEGIAITMDDNMIMEIGKRYNIVVEFKGYIETHPITQRTRARFEAKLKILKENAILYKDGTNTG